MAENYYSMTDKERLVMHYNDAKIEKERLLTQIKVVQSYIDKINLKEPKNTDLSAIKYLKYESGELSAYKFVGCCKDMHDRLLKIKQTK